MAEIAYRSERATVYHGDALDALDQLVRRDADLIIADPPYGVSWQSSMRTTRWSKIAGDDGSLDVPGVLGAYTRKLLWANKHVYVFGYRPDQLAAPLRLCSTCELIWDKGSGALGDLSLPWSPQHEKITFGVYSDCDNPTVKRGGLAARMRSGSVLSVPRVHGGVARHPTEKPVALLRQLVESSSQPGDTVLDPFAGSGSTLVAAILSGRRAIGVDSDPDHVTTMINRVRAAETIAKAIDAA